MKKQRKQKTVTSSILNMDAFYTRQKANEGIQLPLFLPDGTKTDHWIRIRGIDSDAFRIANDTEHRNTMGIAGLKKDSEKSSAIQESILRIRAALVVAWSFGTPCTPENVLNFLREAPHIAEAIDRTAARRAAFFATQSQALPPTPPTPST
jgi:hypothetical protein